jgi:hypothetical protein
MPGAWSIRCARACRPTRAMPSGSSSATPQRGTMRLSGATPWVYGISRPVGANTPGRCPRVMYVAPLGLAHSAPYLHASVVHLGMNGIYRRTSINNTPLCPLRPLCEPQRISHWPVFIGAHQPKNISASPRLRVSHRVSRNERHLSTHINQQYASVSSAPSVRATAYLALAGIHRRPQPKNISASPRLRVSHRVSRNERHLSTHINQQYASVSSAPSVRATAYLALVGIHRRTPTKKHLCVLCARQMTTLDHLKKSTLDETR